MNRVYRIIWSKALRTWVVASELATRNGKGGGGADERGEAAAAPASPFAVDGWRMRACAAAVLLALYAPAHAADLYWDFNGFNPSTMGGTGTWDLTSQFWDYGAVHNGTTGPYRAWNNAALDNAFFQGTAGTVTLAQPITAHNLTFNVSGYTLTGGQLTLGGTDPTIFAVGNATIESEIAGTAGLTKDGGGSLFLTGANTFSGGITLSGGTLRVSDDAAFGAAANTITTTANATLSVDSATDRTVSIAGGTTLTISGAGVGSALFTGSGNLNVANGVTLNDDDSDFTGTVQLNGAIQAVGNINFSSVRNVGEKSSLGAGGTITFTGGSQFSDRITYTGTGDTSNRNWVMAGGTLRRFDNAGSGTLTLTGNFNLGQSTQFNASNADFDLRGVLSGVGPNITFTAGAGRSVTLAGANTFTGDVGLSGGGVVNASILANAGLDSSFGRGSAITITGTTLRYTGTGASTDRQLTSSGNASILNDGTSALGLTGNVSLTGGTLSFGGAYGGTNTISGVISGAGGIATTGNGTWELTGANTYTGATTVNGGTLRVGNAAALGDSTAFTVNSGTLDLNGYSTTMSTLDGSGGTVALGSGTLTVDMAPGTSTYSGVISGSGGLTKLGLGTLTLKGANTYTGATTVNSGMLTLDFAGAGGPTSNIISGASTLNLGGGTLSIVGASGEANSQAFDGLNVVVGNNTLRATSGTGGSMTVNLGAITRSGGIVNFVGPASGAFLTSNATGALGGWATITTTSGTTTTTDYAEVVGGQIVAFDDYENQDNASLWQDGQFLSDEGGNANTAFFNTVTDSKQIAGLKYTAAQNSVVSVGAGQTLGLDGTIIVNSTTGSASQTIQGGSVTGAVGGGTLGVLKNSAGTFTIASDIVDNGGAVGFTVGGTGGGTGTTLGTGTVSLTGDNTYTGATTVSGATLAFDSVANGGSASALGAASSDASNLVLENGTLRYTGATASTDRGFTLVNGGETRVFAVTNATANLTFAGQVTSPDNAGFTKSGAGTLTLSNGGNDYIGATTVSGGTLSVDDLANGGEASGIGASSSDSANLVLQGGGTLQYTGASVTTDRGFTLGNQFGGVVDVSNAGATLEFGGAVVGPAGAFLTKEGAGTLVLSGTNTYAAQTNVNEGTLRAGSEQAFSANLMNLADVAGATLDLAGFDNTVGGLQGGGATGGNVLLGDATLTVDGYNASFSGRISGSGGLTKENGGTQTLVGCNNSYTGPTTILGGTLSVDCLRDGGEASGIGASDSDPANLVISNAYLEYTGGDVTVDRGFNLAGGDGYVSVVSADTTLGFSGQVTGAGRLRKWGSGTLVLSGANTYSGNTVIDEGTLQAGSADAFGTGGISFNGPTATLDLADLDTTVRYLQSLAHPQGTVRLGSATLTIDGSGSIYSGVIEGTGSLVKSGGGTQTLSGCNNTYDGTTTITGNSRLSVSCLSDGGLASSIGDSSAAASNLVLTNGYLSYVGDGDSTNRQFTMGGNAVLESDGTGAIEYTSTAPITMTGTAARTLTLQGANTGNNTLAARIDNLSPTARTTLVKSGSGTWVLTNEDSTYTGVTRIDGGVLAVTKLADSGQASSIGMSGASATDLVIGAGATLRYVGDGDSTNRQFTLLAGTTFIESSGTGTINFSNTGPVTLNGAGAHTVSLGGTNTDFNTFGGTLADASATGKTTLSKYGTGTWVLTGNNTYTGDTVINQGNLMIGNGGNSGNAGAGNVFVQSSDSTLSFNRSDTFNFAGSLTGAGNIAQIGDGTTVLTAANNTIGGVTGVEGGTLQIAGGSSLTTGSAAVDNGTLKVQAGGSLTTPTIAMNSGSTLDVNGTVQAAGGTATTMTGGSGNSTVNVGAGGTLRANGDLGSGSDVVNVAGVLDTGTAKLNLGSGDDTFAFTEGAALLGAGIDAGTGTNDTLQVNHTSALTFDAANVGGFETLVKQNTGALTLTGDQSFANSVQVQAGSLTVDSLTTAAVTMGDATTLNVNGTLQNAGGATATLTGSAGANTVNVADGGTLAASGDLGGGNDTVDLSGTLDTGAGTLALGAGDDTLTLNDGATIAGGGVDAGAQSANDTLILNNALDLTFDGASTAGFEQLIKQNTGTATMTGSQSFTAGTDLQAGVLGIAAGGALTTPTVAMGGATGLKVDGTLQGTGGTAAAITGDAGGQTVAINGTAIATGSLGGGNDTLDVAGTLDTGGGVFDLGDGNDNFFVYDGTNVIGTIDGGAGEDTRVYNIDGDANLGVLLNFEGVTKDGAGTLHINGPGATDLQEVQVLGGTLDVAAGASVVAAADSALTTTVASGATLNVDGSFGCGADADTLTVSGAVSGGGTVELCGGDDTLTLNEGADLTGFTGTIDGGAEDAGDRVVLNNTGALDFGPGNLVGFEFLQKDNVGEATLTRSMAFTGGTALNGGTLTVDTGVFFNTPTVAMGDGTTLNVDGMLEGGSVGSAVQITGGAGAQTVNVTGTATATGDLGAGNDVLDVAGTLNINGGVFALGDGDDQFVVHDGTAVNGTIDGGAGLDSRVYDITGTADLGALVNFEGVTKQGTGTLNINGPGATDLQDVQVLGGMLHIGATASVVGKPGEALTTTVGAGATLDVDGAFGCSDGNDTMSVSGTVSGTGTIDLCDGDDTLTLNDGADLQNGIDGGAQSTADRLVLNNATAMTFNGSATTNFEILQKDNTGAATLTGNAAYSAGTLLNGGALTVADVLTTPTVTMADGTALEVDGVLQAGGGTAAAITGSAGANTVTVAAGATLTATGDLGGGDDVLDAAGRIDTAGGTLSLGAGNDTFNVYDTTDTSLATIDGGAGNDLLDVNVGAGNTVPLGGLLGFESLGKSGDGTLEIHGASNFIDVNLNDGTLRVTGTGSIAAQNTTILSGGILELADGGSYSGTAGDDTFTVAGTVLGTGSPDTGGIDLGGGNDTFTLQDGADLSGLGAAVDGGAGTDAFVADLAGTATLGGAVNFETLTKSNGGTLVLAGPAASSFGTVSVLGGTLDIAAGTSLTGVRTATVASGATLNIDGAFGFTEQADSFTVAGTVTGASAIDMLGGDDTFTLQDGADLSGLGAPVDGGAGTDAFVADLAGTATLGGAVNFETLDKTNTGTLIVAGPAASNFTTVNVAGGTLDVGVNGSLDGVVTGTVASGAALNVDGRYTGSAGNDTLTVGGAVSGGGNIALGDGDDTLTLNDGADLSGLVGALDGGAHGTGDRVVLDNAGAMTFDAGSVVNFEFLRKENVGTATLEGAAAFAGGTELDGGTLTVAGSLTTPSVAMGDDTTLDVDGTLSGAGGSAAAITGSAGANTVAIAGSAVATGDLGAGEDVLDVEGTLNIDGVFALGDGDDAFVVHDGTVVTGIVDGGAGMDSRVYDIDGTADLGALVNFEGVTKRGSGTLNINGPATSILQDVQVLGGTFDIGPDGEVTGVRTATVASGATLNIDGAFGFTEQADSFTVAGTVAGASAIDMLGGDDTFTIQDGADLSGLAGPVDGGAGNDTFVADLAGTATLGGAVNFETLDKTNTGTLIVAGPAASTFTTVNVAGGTLDVGVNGSLDGVVAGTVASGATLNVDGRYTGSAGDDTLTVAGAVTGSGNIALGDGDDTLTLNDGADLAGHSGQIDGGAHGTGDRVVLDNTGELFLPGTLVNFEFLQKDNTGEAIVTGDAAFSGGTELNGGTLTVAGNLLTPTVALSDDTTLDVEGTLQGAPGGAASTITGSDGVNTVVVSGVAAMTGDLGAGNDVLDVAGTLDTAGGTFALGDGDDDFVVHDGTVVAGTIDGGAGLDSRVYDINGTAEFGALASFEGVTKRGTGTLNISGPGATDLQRVEVEGGTLNVGANGSVVATAGTTLDTIVASGATLNVDGSFGCGDGDDTMTVAGTVAGSGTVALCGGDDTLTLQDGAVLANVVDGGADTDTVVLDTATALTLDAASTTNFEVLQKDGAGVATLTGTSTYSGGTLLNGGMLTVTGELVTPTVAMADGTTLDVDGSVHGDGGPAVLTGSGGANTVNVSGDLFASGDLGGGADALDVSGSLNTGGGTFDLGAGDDTLTIHDGTEIIGTVAAGAGNDTFNTDIATNAELGAVQGFETLSKTGIGTLDINGPMSSDFDTVNVLEGTVNVTSGGSVTARTSTVAAGATLQVDGVYTGTDGDDTFTSMGTVRGALAFGAGADTARFVGGDIGGLTSVDGGAGGSDRLSFSGLELDDANAAAVLGWERVELLEDSALTLGGEFALGGGVLAIDGTSRLLASAGAAIDGSVENAGLIDVGGDRLAIGGDYTSSNGALSLTVSAGGASSGGLDVAGDVVGTTNVTFDSDGSVPAEGTTEILVIASPNDDASTAGGFAPAGSADGMVRLDGSPFAWEFGQAQDRNWYLSTEAEPEDVLPEIAGYGVLPGLGTLMGQRGGDIAHQRLSGVRGTEPQCGDQDRAQAGTDLIDDCQGAWVAVTGSEVELGADPGFAVSGDDTGLYAGIDGATERGNASLRGGAYLGYLHSVYWATGENSSAVSGMGPARIDIDTPVVGLYGTSQWDNGAYVDVVLSGQRPRAEVRTADGFTDRIDGDTLTLSARFGRQVRLDGGWTLEPQAQLWGSRVQWDAKTDAAGRALSFDDDLVTGAQLALRVEKDIATGGGANLRPWATLAVRNTFGGGDNALHVAGSGIEPGAFPGHDLGTSANLDLGLEADVNARVGMFGVISLGRELEGSDYEQRSINLGVRVRW